MRNLLHVSIVAVLLSTVCPSMAQTTWGLSGFGRWHSDNDALPTQLQGYFDDTIGYGAAIELHDSLAYWQFGCEYVSDTEADIDADALYTPFANLLLRDRGVIGGLGVLGTYIDDDSDETDDWSDIYFQFQLGFEIPLGKKLGLTATAAYVFSDFGELGDFEFGALDYIATLRYKF